MRSRMTYLPEHGQISRFDTRELERGHRTQNRSMKPFASRLKWYIARLSAMDAPEIAHRLSEAVKKAGARRMTVGWSDFSVPGSLRTNASIGALCTFGTIDSHVAAIIATEAAAVRVGRLALLGARWPKPFAMPPPEDFWHLDPVDSEAWPSQSYCFDVPFRHGVKTREIKRVWEINRLQFLPPLALDAVIHNSEEDRELVVGIVKSWMAGNPPFQGVNWISPIELALRVISVAVSVSVLGTHNLDPDVQKQLFSFFRPMHFGSRAFRPSIPRQITIALPKRQ